MVEGSPDQWDGTLSPDEFSSCALALCARWKEMDSHLPNWNWVPSQRIGASSNADGYLAMENVYLSSVDEVVVDDVCEENHSANEESLDDATLVQNDNGGIHIYDYHIAYSFNYRVPVLYFRGYRYDGSLLKMYDIEKDLPPYSLTVLRESKWTFMTQEDHPYLCHPWFTLHPCGTGDCMKLLLGSVVQEKTFCYLSSWLSVVGQAVGLKIPLALHT